MTQFSFSAGLNVKHFQASTICKTGIKTF